MMLDVQGRPAYAYTGGKPFSTALPCVVFVHGALHDHSVWTLQARYWAHHGHAVLAVDLPGHGRSEGEALPDIESLGAWLLALLDAAGVQQAALVGHSMGSLIALEAAAQAPQRCSRLVMVGSAWPMKVSDALLATARERPLAAMRMVNAFSHAGIAAKPGYPGPGAWLHGGGRALMRRIQAGQTETNLFAHDFKVCDAYAGGMDAAARVTCPAHLILGDRDQMTSPKQTREIATALKAQVHLVPAGHGLMAEAPDPVLRAMRAALGA